jgi:hypothetical protein
MPYGTVAKEKTMIVDRGEAGHPQDMGENATCRGERREELFHYPQMNQPFPAAPVIRLEILWGNLALYCFGEPSLIYSDPEIHEVIE